MKYRFSILAPHPDDEFIGLRQFIKTYGSSVDNIIFVSNGEAPVSAFYDMVEYIEMRRRESETWIKTVMPHADVIYLNVPDATDILDINYYVKPIFEKVNHNSMFDHLVLKIRKLVGDNILLCPSFEKHPTHSLTYSLSQMLGNKKIYYAIHTLMQKHSIKKAGVHFVDLDVLSEKLVSYYYIMTSAELSRKKKEFQTYYNSQYLEFLQTGLDIKNWENYTSEVPLRLTDEDRTYKIKL